MTDKVKRWKVKHIVRASNMRVDPTKIEITHPVPGCDAYWYGDERIVLTDKQKAELAALRKQVKK